MGPRRTDRPAGEADGATGSASSDFHEAPTDPGLPVFPPGDGGGAAETMSAVFGHLTEPAAAKPAAAKPADAQGSLSEARVFLRHRRAQAIQRMKDLLRQRSRDPNGGGLGVDWFSQAGEEMAAGDEQVLRNRFEGKLPPGELERLREEHRESLRTTATNMTVAVLPRMGMNPDVDTEGQNTTKKNNVYKPPPRV